MKITVVEYTNDVETHKRVVSTDKHVIGQAVNEHIQGRIYDLGLTLDYCLYLTTEGEHVRYKQTLELRDEPPQRGEKGALEREKIVDRLVGMLNDIRHLEHDDLGLAVDTLDRVVANCAETLTRIKRLRRWVQMKREDGVPFGELPEDNPPAPVG